jgi:tetratricopeptide (TPR) repeat protein
MKSRAFQGIALGVMIVLGMAEVWNLQRKIDAEKQRLQLESEELMLRSGSMVKRMSLEYAPLMAAIYWTRAVQYFGEKHHLHDQDLQLLWPLLDITTTLDPNLLPAYRTGSSFLSDAPPRGAGEPDLAVKLLERGIKANPEQWRLYQDLGNVYYFDKKDYLKASQAFEKGSELPGALIWMKAMAARIAAEGESLETSYFLWKQIYDTTNQPDLKKNAASHLRMLQVELDCRAISRLADEYEKQTGHRATKMSELVQAGLIRAMPQDPDGYPYVLGESGKAELNLNSPMLEEQVMQGKQ